MSENIDSHLQEGITDLKELAVTFSQLIAGIAVDPHGYFEKKYTAHIEQSESEQEVRGVLAQLVQWAVSSALSSSERKRLDHQLTDLGMPNLEELRVRFLP
jgi:hypothetical protein